MKKEVLGVNNKEGPVLLHFRGELYHLVQTALNRLAGCTNFLLSDILPQQQIMKGIEKSCTNHSSSLKTGFVPNSFFC